MVDIVHSEVMATHANGLLGIHPDRVAVLENESYADLLQLVVLVELAGYRRYGVPNVSDAPALHTLPHSKILYCGGVCTNNHLCSYPL